MATAANSRLGAVGRAANRCQSQQTATDPQTRGFLQLEAVGIVDTILTASNRGKPHLPRKPAICSGRRG